MIVKDLAASGARCQGLFSIPRRMGPSCQEKIPSSCSRGGVDPATTPRDRIPAARTCGINDFLSLLLSWQKCLEGEALSLFCLLRSTLSLPISFLAFAVHPGTQGPKAGAVQTAPHQGWARSAPGRLSVRVVGRTRARVLWDDGILIWQIFCYDGPLLPALRESVSMVLIFGCKMLHL